MNRPRLRQDLVLVEQTYRGEQSYIVKDPETRKYFRFRPVELVVMQEFDGAKTAADVARVLAEQGLPFTPATVEGFARKLSHMGLLERSVAEKSVLMMERLRAERRRRIKHTHYAGSVLRMRWSIGDPDKFFDRWTPRLRFLFSPAFLALSVALFIVYGTVAAARWPELAGALQRVVTPSSYTLSWFLLLYATALVIIAVHELGHGFTCKYFGGQVHEMGAMLLYFQPAFYCNVNDAWTFPNLKARLWVTAAGSWIQVVLAGIAAIVWWAAAPGTLVSQIALNAVVVGGITTVLANANPLIPLDGYYALSDWLEIPNLRDRAFRHLTWLVRRHVLRLKLPQPPADDRETRILLVYGLLALAYSASVLFLVVGAVFGWVSRTLGVLGAAGFLLAIWAMARGALREWTQAVLAALREHRAVWRSGKLWRRVGAIAGLILALGFVVPWPITVTGRFAAAPALVVTLQAPESALVARVDAAEGTTVPAGAPVVVLRNFDLEAEALAARFAADSLAVEQGRALARGAAGAVSRLAAELSEASANAARLGARLRSLVLRAPVGGTVLTPRLEEVVGRRVAAGTEVARLGAGDTIELRVRLERAGATLVAPGQRAAVFVATNGGRTFEGHVSTVAEAGTVQQLEARLHMAGDARGLRAGVTGEARITVRRSSVWGALWWAIRKRVRSDLLL